VRRGRAVAVAALLVLVAACARPPVSNGPSPGTQTSPVAGVATEPTTTPTGEATSATTSTPGHVPLLQITSAVFHAGESGIAYAPVALAATGGVPPLSWSISAGSLPGGLSASTGGSVSGTPTAAGNFAFTVRVDDTAGHSATVNRSIAIAAYLSITALCNSPQCNVEQGCVTVCGTFGRFAGGLGAFRYSSTALPPGMALNGLSLTGPFPPEPVGALPIPWRFQVTMTDSLGASATVSAVFHVFAHVTLTGVPCSGVIGVAFTCSMRISGGSKPVSAALYKYALPPGATISVDPVKMMVVISVPAQKTSGQYTPTLTVTDSSPCAPGANCTSAPAVETIRV
jgi:large repetitive protein